jgi:hypothetical protein
MAGRLSFIFSHRILGDWRWMGYRQEDEKERKEVLAGLRWSAAAARAAEKATPIILVV